MMARLRTLSVIASSTLRAGMLALCLAPSVTLASAPRAPAQAANAKSVSLRLSDVLHVLGGGLTAGTARYNKPSASGACTTTPPVTDYIANFSGPLLTKGVLNVISDVYTYKSAGGPVCNQQTDITLYKTLGGVFGKVTSVHGVGEQAFLLDTTGPKTKLAPVYTLGLKFTRGSYRAIIIVQSHKKIKASDMITLGQIVDGRMKHTH
jgi:hypothetical protein